MLKYNKFETNEMLLVFRKNQDWFIDDDPCYRAFKYLKIRIDSFDQKSYYNISASASLLRIWTIEKNKFVLKNCL